MPRNHVETYKLFKRFVYSRHPAEGLTIAQIPRDAHYIVFVRKRFLDGFYFSFRRAVVCGHVSAVYMLPVITLGIVDAGYEDRCRGDKHQRKRDYGDKQ